MQALKMSRGIDLGLPPRLKKWLALLAGLLVLGFVAFVVLPVLSDVLGFREAHNLIIEENIEAGAWFYIFVEKIKDIEPAIRDTLQHTPRNF